MLWSGPVRFIPGYRDSLPLAATQQGLARGEWWASRSGRPVAAWRGLRYAKPPTGERRFRPAAPLGEEETWEGEQHFNREMPECYQVSLLLLS